MHEFAGVLRKFPNSDLRRIQVVEADSDDDADAAAPTAKAAPEPAPKVQAPRGATWGVQVDNGG